MIKERYGAMTFRNEFAARSKLQGHAQFLKMIEGNSKLYAGVDWSDAVADWTMPNSCCANYHLREYAYVFLAR